MTFQEKIARINELAHKAKTPEGLTEAEKAERAVLRQEYLAVIRGNLEAQLDNMYVLDENGNEVKIEKKYDIKH